MIFFGHRRQKKNIWKRPKYWLGDEIWWTLFFVIVNMVKVITPWQVFMSRLNLPADNKWISCLYKLLTKWQVPIPVSFNWIATSLNRIHNLKHQSLSPMLQLQLYLPKLKLLQPKSKNGCMHLRACVYCARLCAHAGLLQVCVYSSKNLIFPPKSNNI